jgi:2-polyprenyl-3-methyl-5-hydroxy-6-metoxy-1,4-benzoquinol methylase
MDINKANHNLSKILNEIYKRSPLQKKKLKRYLSLKDLEFQREAEQFADDYVGYLSSQNISLEWAVEAFLGLCDDMMQCQASFLKTGLYPAVNKKATVYENIYNSKSRMKAYMVGLALSLYLWPTHYEMFSFLRSEITKYSDSVHSYLEIGPGHGLFLMNALNVLINLKRIVAVDISEESIRGTKSIAKFFFGNRAKEIEFYVSDILEYTSDEEYDFIVAGEVLEHVEEPHEVLKKIRSLLKDNGLCFISTCTNAPAPDHLYHFKTIEEIEKLITNNGFFIQRERVLPVEDLPMHEIVRQRVTINYCALIRR